MRILATLALLFCTWGTSQAQINVPAQVDVYKPIVISSAIESDVYIWHLSDKAVRLTVDDGKGLHVWAPPGVYDVRLTVIKVDWEGKKVAYNEHFAQFKVVGTKPDDPVDPVDPVVPNTSFKKAVADALKSVDSSATSYRRNIANNYLSVANEAENNPSAWDAATMVNEVKTRNTSALPASVLSGWSSFWPKLARAFTDLRLQSNDLKGHIKAFKEVHEVLSK
jgi:hypothetical protein